MLTDKVEDKTERSIGTTKDQTKNEEPLMNQTDRKSEFMKNQTERELMKNQTERELIELMKDPTENELIKGLAENGLANDQAKSGLTKENQLTSKYKDVWPQEKFIVQTDQPKIQEPISQGQITKPKIKKVRFGEITECQLDQDYVLHNSKEFQQCETFQSSSSHEKSQNKIEKTIDVTLSPEKATKLFGKLGLAEAWAKFVSPKSQNKK
ncbi:4150_t:CDS:2, partial [Dentiscutata erythropus]